MAPEMRGIVALLIATAFATTPQQDLPRFRRGVDVVQFTVTVLDKDRRPVSGLTASDFEVLVDGKPRPLSAFAAVTLPADSAPAVPPVALPSPDVQTNRLAPEGRLVVIVMDRSITNGEPMRAARAVARAALDRLAPGDIAGVVYTASGLRMYSQGLTSDRARLRAAVDQTTVGALEEPPPPPSLAGFAASRGAPPAPKAQRRVQLQSEQTSGECFCGVCVPDTLTALARLLTVGMTRHKSILFIGSDIALGATDTAGQCAAFIYPARDRLTRALDEANVTFHVIDPRGLESLGDTAELEAPIGRVDLTTNMFRQMTLAILPDATGGRTIVNSNKPSDAVRPIFEEDRSYYVLGITRDPAVAGGDDRRQITIRAKRTDATVHARKVYFAADPNAGRTAAPSAAAAALGELLPRADFPLQMNLVPQFSPDGSPEVRVLLGVASEVAGKLDVLIGTFDRTFNPAAPPVKQKLDVPASVVAGTSAFQWGTVLKTPPGDYEMRAAVATADGKRAASVIGYVTVPDVSGAGFALSGVVVKSAGAPTLRRVFSAGEPIALSFQIAHAKNERVSVSTRYWINDEQRQTVASGSVPPADGLVESHDVTVRMPSAAGSYVATVEASAGSRSTRRDVLLTVR